MEIKIGELTVRVSWQHMRKKKYVIATEKKTGKKFVATDYKKGGFTRCTMSVTTPTGLLYTVTGGAKCNKLDNYNKDRGRKESLAVVFKYDEEHGNTFITNEVRKAIWDAYFNRKSVKIGTK